MQLFSFVVDWTIVAGEKDVKLYIDEECTTLMPGPVHFGEIPQGEERDFTFYAKNEGTIPTDIHIVVEGTPSEGVTVSVVDAPITDVQPDQVVPFTVHVDVAPEAVLEAGTVTVVGNDSPV